MKSITKLLLAAAALAVTAGGAYAQDRGPALAIKDADPIIKNAAERMGLIRNRTLVIGQVNVLEMVATGSYSDIEAATPAAAAPITEWRWAVNINTNIPGGAAYRMDFTQGGKQTIQVVKGNKAWNEAWSADKKKLTTTAADASAALRAQLLWAEPHAFIQAAAFASAKKTPDGKAGTPMFSTAKEGGVDTVTVEIAGNIYKATMEPAPGGRPVKIETDLKMPGGGTKKFTATFVDWRAGEKPDAGFSNAFGNSLDKFHNGTYWPSKMAWDLGGTKILDVTLTEGWGNPYVVFPDPELLAKAQ